MRPICFASRSGSGAGRRSPISPTSRSRSVDRAARGAPARGPRAANRGRSRARPPRGSSSASSSSWSSIRFASVSARQLMLALYRSGGRRRRSRSTGERGRPRRRTSGIEPTTALRDARAADPRAGRGARPWIGHGPTRRRPRRPVEPTSGRAAPRRSLSRSYAVPLRELIVARLVDDEGELERGSRDPERAARVASASRRARRRSRPPTRPATPSASRRRTTSSSSSSTRLPDLDAERCPARSRDPRARHRPTSPCSRADRRLAAGNRRLRSVRGRRARLGGAGARGLACRRDRRSPAARRNEGRPGRGRRDASRLLADASLAVQRIARVDAVAAPRRADRRGASWQPSSRDPRGLIGMSPRWRHEGVGRARRALVRDAGRAPCCSCGAARGPAASRRGESRTRFTLVAVGLADAGISERAM